MRATLLAAVAFAALALAGCAADEDPVFPPTDESAGPQSALEGIVVSARLVGGGPAVTVRAEAENTGSRTWQVPAACAGQGATGGVTQPWSIAARRVGVDLAFPIYPVSGECRDVLLHPFPPGARSSFEVAWNGSFYSLHFEEFVDVFPGDYEVDVAFELYADNQGRPVVLELPVQVLDHGQ